MVRRAGRLGHCLEEGLGIRVVGLVGVVFANGMEGAK